MKLRALLAAVFVLALGAAVANAGAASEFGINAGVAMPMSDFSDVASTGFFGGANYCYLLNAQFGVGADINYYKFGKKDFTVLGTSVSSDLSMIQYTLHGKYLVALKDSKEMPYFKVGVGMYSVSAKAGGTTTSKSELGFNLGAGADWKMGEKKSWGAEVLYHNISKDKDIPNSKAATMVTVALRYNWMMMGK